MTSKQIIVALSIFLAVSATAVQLTSAAKPKLEGMTQSSPPANGQPKGENTKPSRDKPGNAGKQNGMKIKNDKKPPANNKGAKTATDATYGGIADKTANSVVISGGFNTDSQDHGRPVVLIAAALGVPTEVFREAFSGVTPAGAGSGGPTQEEAQKNKTALMKVLEPYGITNARLDEVSNYYRYNGSKGEVWTRTQATASAIVTNGVVTGVKITNAGSGYSSNPTITINGPTGKITATATVSYTKDFKTNGSISAITIH